MDTGGVEEAWGGQRLSCDDVYVMDFVGVVRPYMGRSHLQSSTSPAAQFMLFFLLGLGKYL